MSSIAITNTFLAVLAQTTLGEGAALVGTGGVIVAVLSLLVKHGAKLTIGKDPEAKTNGNGGGNGKQLTPQVCPAHEEFSQKLDERHAAQKEALAAIARNQDNQQKLLLAVISELKASSSQVRTLVGDVSEVKGTIVRLHERIDKAVNGKAQGHECDHNQG